MSGKRQFGEIDRGGNNGASISKRSKLREEEDHDHTESLTDTPSSGEALAKLLANFVKKHGPEAARSLLKGSLPPQSAPQSSSSSSSQNSEPPTTWNPITLRMDSQAEFQTPWITRKSFSVDHLWQYLSASLSSFCNKSVSGRDYVAFVISGASGTGKTRTGYQIGPLLADRLRESGWSYARYFAPPPVPTSKNSSSPSKPMADVGGQRAAEKWLKQSLALHHGVDDGDALSWPVLLQGVRSALLDSPSSTPRQKLLLLVQIDEFQTNRSLCTHLVRQLSKLLTTTTYFHDEQVLIVPIFTGTWIGPIALATDYQTHQYLLSGLDSLTDARNFFQTHLLLYNDSATLLSRSHKSSVKSRLTEDEENAILGHLGYIPRMIRLFCQLIGYNSPADFESAWPPLTRAIISAYPSNLTPLEQQHICLLSYFKIPVATNYRVNGHTVLDIMVEGSLFLSGTPGFYTVVLPTIFFITWLPQYFDQHLFTNPKNQLDEHTLPNLALNLHRTTYSMFRVWSTVQQELKIQHTPSSLNIETALRNSNQTLPPLQFDSSSGQLKVMVSLRLIYAGAAEGSKAVLDTEFQVVVDDGETIGPPPVTPNDPKDQSIPTHPLSLTAPRDSAADAVTPHLVAEQYKADLHFNRGGQSQARYSDTDLIEELAKELYGRKYLMFISPAQINAEIKDNGIELHFKPERNSKRGRPSYTELHTQLVPHLLLIRGPTNLAKFCRGFLRNSKLLELDDAAKTIFSTTRSARLAASSSK